MNTKIKTADKAQIKEAYSMLLAMDTNWPLLKLIGEKPGQNVTELMVKMRMVQSDVSIRLSRLKSFGIVEGNKIGKEVYYSLTEKALKVASKINAYVKR